MSEQQPNTGEPLEEFIDDDPNSRPDRDAEPQPGEVPPNTEPGPQDTPLPRPPKPQPQD